MVVIPVPVSESLTYTTVKQCFADDFYGNRESFVRESVVPQKWHWTGGRRNLFVNHCFEQNTVLPGALFYRMMVLRCS